MFAKKQRVEYNDRVVSADTWVPAQVIGVHLDDGPENPYYTIAFQRTRDGETEDMEKQTQPERIRRYPKKEPEPAAEPEAPKEEEGVKGVEGAEGAGADIEGAEEAGEGDVKKQKVEAPEGGAADAGAQ